jgi:hypothetical protein
VIHHGRVICPTCVRPVDLGEGLSARSGRSAPRKGDITICVTCLERLTFTESDRVVVLTDAQFDQLHPRAQLALDNARLLIMSCKDRSLA